MVIARVGYHLTVLEGKLTAVDFEDFEVLELGKTWKKKSYRGAARPHFNPMPGSLPLLAISEPIVAKQKTDLEI